MDTRKGGALGPSGGGGANRRGGAWRTRPDVSSLCWGPELVSQGARMLPYTTLGGGVEVPGPLGNSWWPEQDGLSFPLYAIGLCLKFSSQKKRQFSKRAALPDQPEEMEAPAEFTREKVRSPLQGDSELLTVLCM